MEEFLGRMRRVEVPIEDRILRRPFSDRRGRYRTSWIDIVTEGPIDDTPRALRECLSRSEEHTSQLQSQMCISYAVSCLKKKNTTHSQNHEKRSLLLTT